MPPEGQVELAHPEVAGWMLGNLDPAEADSFRIHLEDCPHCQAAVAELSPVSQALRRLPPAVEPPPELEERTLAAVLDAARDAKRSPKARSRFRWPSWNLGLVAAAAAVAVAAAFAVVLTTRPSAKPAPAAAPGASPTLGVTVADFALHSPSGGPARGQAIGTDHGAVGWSFSLSVHGLPPLPSVQYYYECWYVESPTGRPRISGGTFTVGRSGTGTFTMWSGADPRTFKIMWITQRKIGDPGPGSIVLIGHASL